MRDRQPDQRILGLEAPRQVDDGEVLVHFRGYALLAIVLLAVAGCDHNGVDPSLGFRKAAAMRLGRPAASKGEDKPSQGQIWVRALAFEGQLETPSSVSKVTGEVVNQAAFDLLKITGTNRPLFLLVHYMDAHRYATSEYTERIYPAARSQSSNDTRVHRYEAAVADTDRYMDQFLTRWRNEIGFENTMSVFFSDHGEHLGEPGAPASGHGRTMQEAMLHVPLLVRFPEYLAVPRPDGLADDYQGRKVSIIAASTQ